VTEGGSEAGRTPARLAPLAGLARLVTSARLAPLATPSRLAPLAILAVILAVAAFLRFWDLASNPGGLYGDEAAEGLDAWRLLHQPGFRPDFLVWFQNDGGREALFAYVVAGAFSVFGSSALVLRGVAAAFGVAGVAAVWWLTRRFGTWTALAAAAWAAGSLWLVCVSRDGMRNTIVPFFGAVAAIALLRWADRAGRGGRGALLAAIAAGAVTALAALYTYQPLKLLPAVVALWWLWLRLADRPSYLRLRPGILPFCAAFLLVAAPMLAVAVTNPANYFGRIATTSPFNPDTAAHLDIVRHTLVTLTMFGLSGDPNQRHNVPELPLLSIPLTLVALAGLLRLWRMRRTPEGSLILISLPVFMIPPLAGVDGGAPHFLRALGLAAPLGVTVGLGAAEIVDRARSSRPGADAAAGTAGGAGAARRRWARPLAIGLVAATLAVTAAWTGLAYFTRPIADRYEAYSYPLTAMAEYAAAHPGAAVILDEHSGYVVEFLDADEGTVVYAPGVKVPSPSAHPLYLALSAEDFRAALGDAAVERAVAVAWDPRGRPAVWATTP
jgi:4-amino-4-deoxy-L-arabinose transferase-like glycosyltransferase